MDVGRGKIRETAERDPAKLPHGELGVDIALDCWAGADPAFWLPVRVVTETAWHNLFARNMFIQSEPAALAGFDPAFTNLHAPGLTARGKGDGVNSGTFILVDFDRRVILIGGSWYAGEIMKSIFGVLNYVLLEQGPMPMHCSAIVDPKGDAAIFFRQSGTGKTALSANGTLIGDDENGWSDRRWPPTRIGHLVTTWLWGTGYGGTRTD